MRRKTVKTIHTIYMYLTIIVCICVCMYVSMYMCGYVCKYVCMYACNNYYKFNNYSINIFVYCSTTPVFINPLAPE